MTRPDNESNVPPLPGVFRHASKYLTPRQQSDVLQPVVEFLREYQPRVGRIITGVADGRWTKKDVRELEKLVVAKAPSVKAIEDFLRVLRKACRYWILERRSDDISRLKLPRIPVLPPEVKYPFQTNYPKAVARYDAWKRTLEAAIPGPERAESAPKPGIPELIVSAVLFGGLHSMDQLVALTRAVAHLPERVICVDERMHVELRVSWHGIADVELRRWQPDPLSATLLMRVSPEDARDLLAPADDQTPVRDNEIAKRLRNLVCRHFRNFASTDDRRMLLRLPALIQATQVVARRELPVLVAEYAAREFISQSFPRSTLQRFSKEQLRFIAEQIEATSERSASCIVRPQKDSNALDTELAGAADLSAAFGSKQILEVRKQLQQLRDQNAQTFIGRVADFGDYLVTVPTASGARLTISAVKDAVSLLLKHMGCLLNSQDVADFPTEKIESIYLQILEGTGVNARNTREARRLRVALARVLRSFHEYLTVCCKKDALTDRSILFCGETISEVDADLLTIEEMREVLRHIDRAPIDRLSLLPAQRQIARLLVILGFRCGLRRREALYCKIRDVLVDRDGTPVELLVRPSEMADLKTPNARRRIPFGDVPEEDELKELIVWILERKKQSESSDELLFADPTQNLKTIPETIFKEINAVIKDVTGSSAHFHHTRHSAATGILIRLLIEDGKISEDFFPHLEATSAWLKTGARLRRTLYNHDKPTRKHPYKLAQFMGHGSVKTSYASYVHMLDWMLPAFTKKAPVMCPDIELVRKASGVLLETAKRWEENAGPLAIPLTLFRKRAERPNRSTMRERSKSSVPASRTPADWVNDTRFFLFSTQTWRRPLDEVVRLRLTDPENEEDFEKELEMRSRQLARAKYIRDLRSGPTFRHPMQLWCPDRRNPSEVERIACPPAPVQPYDRGIVARLSAKVDDLANSSSGAVVAMVDGALSTYVHHVWRSKPRVVFHTPSEAEQARNYITFLNELDIPLKDIAWYSYADSPRSPECVAWRKALRLEEYTIELIAPDPDEDSKREWFAIMPRFAFKNEDGTKKYPGTLNPGAYGFRYLMLMAFIKFGKLTF